MAFLWFGKQKKLEDMSIKELRKEITKQQVEQDQLVSVMRRAQEQYDGYLEAASEPGLLDADVQISAQKMDIAEKRKLKAESELQDVITNIDVLDSVIGVIEQKEALQKKGIWQTISKMEPSELEGQLTSIAIERKNNRANVDKITEILSGANIVDVAANRSAGHRRALDKIKAAREEKS